MPPKLSTTTEASETYTVSSSGVENVLDHGTIGPRKFFGVARKYFGRGDYHSLAGSLFYCDK